MSRKRHVGSNPTLSATPSLRSVLASRLDSGTPQLAGSLRAGTNPTLSANSLTFGGQPRSTDDHRSSFFTTPVPWIFTPPLWAMYAPTTFERFT